MWSGSVVRCEGKADAFLVGARLVWARRIVGVVVLVCYMWGWGGMGYGEMCCKPVAHMACS